MALGKVRTSRFVVTLPTDCLDNLGAHAVFRKCSIAEVIRQQVYALGPVPAEPAVRRSPASIGVEPEGPKVDPDFNFGA